MVRFPDLFTGSAPWFRRCAIGNLPSALRIKTQFQETFQFTRTEIDTLPQLGQYAQIPIGLTNQFQLRFRFRRSVAMFVGVAIALGSPRIGASVHSAAFLVFDNWVATWAT